MLNLAHNMQLHMKVRGHKEIHTIGLQNSVHRSQFFVPSYVILLVSDPYVNNSSENYTPKTASVV
jgi:hypothetical protein